MRLQFDDCLLDRTMAGLSVTLWRRPATTFSGATPTVATIAGKALGKSSGVSEAALFGILLAQSPQLASGRGALQIAHHIVMLLLAEPPFELVDVAHRSRAGEFEGTLDGGGSARHAPPSLARSQMSMALIGEMPVAMSPGMTDVASLQERTDDNGSRAARRRTRALAMSLPGLPASWNRPHGRWTVD